MNVGAVGSRLNEVVVDGLSRASARSSIGGVELAESFRCATDRRGIVAADGPEMIGLICEHGFTSGSFVGSAIHFAWGAPCRFADSRMNSAFCPELRDQCADKLTLEMLVEMRCIGCDVSANREAWKIPLNESDEIIASRATDTCSVRDGKSLKSFHGVWCLRAGSRFDRFDNLALDQDRAWIKETRSASRATVERLFVISRGSCDRGR